MRFATTAIAIVIFFVISIAGTAHAIHHTDDQNTVLGEKRTASFVRKCNLDYPSSALQAAMTPYVCAYFGPASTTPTCGWDASNNQCISCKDRSTQTTCNPSAGDFSVCKWNTATSKCESGTAVMDAWLRRDTCNRLSNVYSYASETQGGAVSGVYAAKCDDSLYSDGRVNTAAGEADPAMQGHACQWDSIGKICYNRDHGVPVASVCTCNNGSPVSPGADCDAKGGHGAHACTSCSSGYYLDSATSRCKPNPCKQFMDEGKATSASACSSHPDGAGGTCNVGGSAGGPGVALGSTVWCWTSAIPTGSASSTSYACTCPNGQKVDTCAKNGEECKSCDAGRFLRASDKTCVECTAGTSQGTPAFSGASCSQCTTASFSTAPGATSCTQCPVGTKGKTGMGHTTQASACSSCDSGSFQGQAGQSTCTPCPAGTKGNVGTGHETQAMACSNCEVGTFQSQQGELSCTQCAADEHQDAEGQDHCKANRAQCNAAEVETTKPTASLNRVCTNPSDDAALDTPQKKTAACNTVLAHYQDALACGGSEQKCMSASLKSSDDRKECRRVKAIYRGAKCPCPTASAAGAAAAAASR